MKPRNLVAMLFAVFLICTMAFQSVLAQVYEPITGPTGTTQYPWVTQFANDGKTGFNNGPAPNTPHLLWATEVGSAGPARGMSIAQGLVYQGCYVRGGVYALDQNTGEEVWHWDRPYGTSYQLRYMDGMVFTTKSTLPVTPINEPGVGMLVPDRIVALNATTGAQMWEKDLQGATTNVMAYDHRIWAPAIVYDPQTALTTRYSAYLVLDARTGNLVKNMTWGTHLMSFDGRNGYGIASGAYRPPNSTGTTILYSMNIDTYAVNWAVSAPHSGTTVITGGSVFVIGTSSITRFEQSTGILAWTFNTGLTGLQLITIGYNKIVFYGLSGDATHPSTHGTIQAIDEFTHSSGAFGATENFLWQTEVPGTSADDGAAADGKIYYADFSGHLNCLNVYTGEIIWQWQGPYPLGPSVGIADGKVFVGDTGGNYYCFGDAPSSSVSLSASSSVTVGQSVTLTGKMTDGTGAGIAGASITLSSRASFMPVVEWNDFATVTTGLDGSFSYSMALPNEGYYDFRASYCEPSLGGYAASNAMTSVRATVQTPAPVDLNPMTEKISSLESAVSTLQTVLIIIAVLLVVAVIVIAASWMWPKKTRT